MLELLASFYLGIQVPVQLLPPDTALAQVETNTSASALEIFRNAYENRYRWDSSFPGYTATVKVSQKDNNYQGNIIVNPDLTVKVEGITNKEVQSMVKNQLRMIIVHRRQVAFETDHKNSTFELGSADKNGAVQIIEHGDKTKAFYKVFQNELIQINRILGNMAVTVNVLSSQKTPSGYLATRYKTIFRQPENNQAVGEVEQQDSYRKLGKYYLPTRQVIHDVDLNQNESSTTVLDFTNIRLNN